jgi:site-specific recombinase XerD
VSDEIHADYIRTILDRATHGIPLPKSQVMLPQITSEDEDMIKEFVAEIQATAHVTLKRAYKYTYILVHWRYYIGEYKKNTIADLYAGITTIQKAKDSAGNAKYSRHTLADYIGFLKKFYLWMSENHYTDIDEKKIRKIRPPTTPVMTKTAEMLLTPVEVRKIIDACQNPRDRAIISMMYEGGFRIGEIATLRWQQVKFNEWNVAVNVDNKTLKPRYVPLVMARSYLAQWKNDYPIPISEESFVFITSKRHEQLQYRGFVKQLEKIISRAGITKHVSPHIFRHSRITHLIQQGFGESKIKLMMWGTIDSDMFKAYAHLTNDDLDAEVARQSGIILPEQREKPKCLSPQQCPQCYTINSPTQKLCELCGSALNGEARNEVRSADEQLAKYLTTPEGLANAINVLQRMQAEQNLKARP